MTVEGKLFKKSANITDIQEKMRDIWRKEGDEALHAALNIKLVSIAHIMEAKQDFPIAEEIDSEIMDVEHPYREWFKKWFGDGKE